MADLTFGKAINQALRDAMTADDRVTLWGEDIAAAGGPFGVTRGLLQLFGSQRVLDTPISEAALVGTAVGAAASGLRPVVEIMFMDFITLAMDALVNQAAKAHFMLGGQSSIPLVIRTPHGGGVNAGPQHSQCLEAWFAHVPGLKVVVPSRAADAYGLLCAAISDPNPVVFVENKTLYARRERVIEPLTAVPIGKARVDRPGDDVTVVTYGATLYLAREAAELLDKEGISIEIIDLRSVQPWDEVTVLESLSKTHRVVIVHEAVKEFGVGAEIAARLSEIGFKDLHAPIVRLGARFSPIPFAKTLESQFLPNRLDLVDAVKRAVL